MIADQLVLDLDPVLAEMRRLVHGTVPFSMSRDHATRFAWLETPAVTIWLAHRAPCGFDDIEPEWRPEGALFTRRRGAVALQPLAQAEHRLLTMAAAGASENDAAAALPDADIPSLIARLRACGALRSA